jgi:hypothetical protein
MFQYHNRDNKTQTKYNITIIVILPLVILLLAWVSLKMNLVPVTTLNNGAILNKEVKLSELKIKMINKDAVIKSEATWKLMLVGCSNQNKNLCKEVIYNTGQVIKALGKNSRNVLRMYIVNHQENRDDLNLWKQTKNYVYAYDNTNSLEHSLGLSEWPEANVFLIDKNDRICMRYLPKQTGGELLADLKKLLRNNALMKHKH